MRRSSYVPPMPWGPPMMPTRPTRTPADRILTAFLTVVVPAGLLAFVYLRAGLLALILAAIVGVLVLRSPRRGRDLIMCAAAGVLLVMLAGPAPTTKGIAAPHARQVERKVQAQADTLAEFKQGVLNLYAQVMKGGSK